MNVTSLPGISSLNSDLFQIQKYAAYFFISNQKKNQKKTQPNPMSSVMSYIDFLSLFTRSVYLLEDKPAWGTIS